MASITLSDVTKSFDGGHAVVDCLTLDVRDGEFMVLVGPSGCGKMTAATAKLTVDMWTVLVLAPATPDRSRR